MKTFKQFLRCAFVAVVVMLGFSACSKDDVEPYNWLDQPFTFNISYSTGEAKWNPTNPETLVLNKLGVGMTGTVPYLKVQSNTFWTISVPEDCDWLRLSLSADVSFEDAKRVVGGPTSDVVKTDDQITNVYIKLTENRGDTQNVTLKFKFSSGLEYAVPISQKGALSSDVSSLLTFLKDGFGKVDGEDVVIKFYPFSETRASDGKNVRTYEGVAVSGDATGRPFSYAGSEGAYVSDSNASEEYTILTASNEIPASGGANILLDGKSYFDIRVFNNQGKSDFQFFFAAKNDDGKYRSKDLKLWISKDGVNWTVDANEENDGSIAYDRFVSESVNGWALSRAKFSIVPGVSNILYFRFQNTSNDAYRIDDILVEEYDGETDQIFSLIQIGSDVLGLPVNFNYTDLKASNLKGNYWMTNAIILSNESGVYKEASEEEEVPTIPESSASSAHVQFICGTNNSLVKTRTDSDGNGGCGLVVTSSAPKVVGMYEGDFWIWTLPVHKVSASTNVRAAFTFKETDAGPKYFYFEWAQCTQDEYKFANKNILLFDDVEKREFYNSLDWKVYNPTSVEVPNKIDASKYDDGIPMGSAKTPSGYWKGTIDYSTGFAGIKGGSDVNQEIVCNFPEAMESGYFFFRLRAAHNLTTGNCDGTTYQRINRATHAGTSYLTKNAVFTFDGCGKQQEYENAFRVLPSFSDSFKGETRTDLTPKYVSNGDLSVAGVFAGTSLNIGTTTQGNNVLNGSCEVNETGKPLYFYSPYNASNTGDASDIQLSVPASQIFDDGYLVANSVPVTSNAPVSFKTTNTMRVNTGVRSAVLELNVYTGKLFSSNLSRIEISTVNPDNPSDATTNIAGSYHYDLLTNTRGESVALSHTITAKAVEALTIPGERKNALKLYFGLWEGTHKLYLKLYMGAVYYAVPLDAAEFTENNITSFDIQVDKYPSYASTEALTGIANAEQLREFCEAVAEGKKGKDLDAYRNIDGELGFGGAIRDEDKVIDMAGVDMSTWPMITLPENFNGGNYTIKNLIITNLDDVRGDGTSIALFQNIAYGYTISNITFDSSCRIDIDSDGTAENNWAFLCLGSDKTACGNFYNIINYGDMYIRASKIYNIQVGSVIAKASCAPDDVHEQSTITACKNYGKLVLRDITTDIGGSACWNGYRQIGCIVGKNMGMLITGCENHGEIILDNIDCKTGSFYVAGIAGYNTNRTDSNVSMLLGLIQDCSNYGKITAGQENPIKVYGLGLAGIAGRMQWGILDKCTNYAAVNVKGVALDSWGENSPSYYSYTDWASKIKATTNSNAFFSVGGIFAFVQHNIATAATFTSLTNAGDIYVECNQEGTITYADNAGISVGGITGRTGANAYNPHFEGCTNVGNITLKSNVATAEAFVGGICGHFAGNQNKTPYVPYCQGSSNNATISFITDNPETVVAHAGGICGSVIYGNVSICVNAGDVNNASTNEASTAGSIIGCRHRSTITPTSNQIVAFTLSGNAAGGSVNGVALDAKNYLDYIYGGYEGGYAPTFAMNSDGTNSNTLYTGGR